MPALTTITTTYTRTVTTTIVGSGTTSSVTWHNQGTTGAPWIPGINTPNFSMHSSRSDQSSTQSSMTMGSQPSPTAWKHSWGGPGNHFPSKDHPSGHHWPSGGHPPQGNHSPPGDHFPPNLPLPSVQTTASLLFTQLTELFPLFQAWTSGEAGSTGEVSTFLSGTKDTAMLTAYQLGGAEPYPKNCGASLLDATSCIVQDLLKAEKALSSGSTNGIMKVVKTLEMHQRNLLTFLGKAGTSSTSMRATGTAPSARVMQSGGLIASAGRMTSGTSLPAGSFMSTGALSPNAPVQSSPVVGAHTTSSSPTSSGTTSQSAGSTTSSNAAAPTGMGKTAGTTGNTTKIGNMTTKKMHKAAGTGTTLTTKHQAATTHITHHDILPQIVG